MQFSYLSCSFLNHIERFGFSNTYGEMRSLYSAAIEELKKKKKQKKANKSSRKQFSPFYLSRWSGLTFITWVKRCTFLHCKIIQPVPSKSSKKHKLLKSNWRFDQKSHIYLILLNKCWTLHQSWVMSPLVTHRKDELQYSNDTSAGKYSHVSHQFCLLLFVLFLFVAKI